MERPQVNDAGDGANSAAPDQQPIDEEMKDQKAPAEDTDDVDAQEELWLKMMSSEIGVKKYLHQETKPIQESLRWDVLIGRTLDTVEDVVTIIRRKPYDWGWKQKEGKQDMKTIVVLGSGWAAHALMKITNTYNTKLVIVSPVNHFVFTPMLASAAVGSVEYRSMTEAVRRSNPMVEYIEGKAVDVDVEKKTVTVELESLLQDTYKDAPPPDPLELSYDSLVCAVGTRTQASRIPGASEHCYYLKTCDDSRRLRTAVGEALEYASRPDIKNDPEEKRRRITVCIVGGGPTGVELAGELSDFFADITKERKGQYPKLKDSVNVKLIHGGDSLVPAFDESLRDHALQSLQKKGVDVRLNTYTTQVGNGFVNIMDKNTKEEERLDVGITVWAAGVEAVPFSKKLLDQLPSSAKGQAGRVNVDKFLRPPVPSPELMGSLFVLGDAAALPSDHDSSQLLPQTAQVAGQQGAYLGRLLNRQYNLTAPVPYLPEGTPSDTLFRSWLQVRGIDEAAPVFTFLNLGLLAYVGGGEALAAVSIGDVPIMSYAGSVGFVLWRSVYLVKQVATRNRVLVTFDWIKTQLFGRDVTRL